MRARDRLTAPVHADELIGRVTEGVPRWHRGPAGADVRPVLVAVAGNHDADEVVAWGAREASLRGCPLRLVHVYAVPPAEAVRRSSTTAARQAYREAAGLLEAWRSLARQLVPRLAVDVVARSGGRIEVLLQEAQNAQLVVVGAGEGWRTGESSGAVAAQLVGHATSPVLVVRRGRGRGKPHQPRVVVGVSGVEGTAGLLAAAFREAELRHLGLVALHAHSTAGGAGLLAQALDGWPERFPHVAVERELSSENAAAALVHASEGAELLVVGARGSGGFDGLRLGSACDAALRYAACPVLVDSTSE